MSATTLQKDYKERIVPALEKQFNYTTFHLYTSDAADE